MTLPVIKPRPQPAANEPRVVGRHVYGNLYDCEEVELLKDEKALRDIVVEAAKLGNMTLLDVKSWKIGEGVSVVAVILESHITIHTWPEYRFATVDVYSCGKHTDPQRAFQYIVSKLRPRHIEVGAADRSLE
ncbi:S-adenosylmethionine decarboxylase proenzyme [Pyrolobus fumarii 1A]|uniref:S-adenosylmethionine decarboxylase proenzyme n=1 Tax=Pyrolobus fumarii (strain DSM 11204 / 1A) TaxID=694429 RepID=G0EEQ2_PYRF1|nr:adenosylmethionine decarboxylase [Pyrolobus fumarii]AEM38874.1 S-adenosylmethionine decarboxylase proenzyme [Pyrolobus fumarii 1A]